MSGSVNKQIAVGHLGRDPESRTTRDGAKVVTFALATSESWKDKATGERREFTTWHNVVIFNEPVGEIAMKYLKKGSLVWVEGQSITRSFERDGQKHYRTELVVKPFSGSLTLLDRAEKQPAPEADAYGSAMPDDNVPL